MCTGFEWLMAGAAGLNAVSQISQGAQAKRLGDYQAAQAAADAQAEREAGIVAANKTRRDALRQRSAARAAIGASGIETGAGTPLVIEGEIERSGEEGALQQILYGARRGTRLEQEGELARMAGENRQAAGYMGAFGSLLSGGAQIAKGWRVGTQSPAPVSDGVLRIR